MLIKLLQKLILSVLILVLIQACGSTQGRVYSPDPKAARVALNDSILDFNDYNVTKCPPPTVFVITSDPKEQAEQEGYSDIEYADCRDKHNNLIDEISGKLLKLQ